MTAKNKAARRPRAFRVDDPQLRRDDPAAAGLVDGGSANPAPTDTSGAERTLPIALKRGARWGAWLISSLTGLITLVAGLWLHGFVAELLARNDWIGWTGLALLALAGFTALMLILREIMALARIRRITRIKHAAEAALRDNDKPSADAVIRTLGQFFAGRADMAWRQARLADHKGEIMDGAEWLTLAERELMAPLDDEARSVVAAASRRISVVTAISPVALVDMLFVAAENLRMLRRLALLYGGRPGTLGLLKLARMVVTHMVVTGGIAIGDDLIQQLIGQNLAGRLSARFGEGVFNGALTARIGLAAIDVCRPMPFVKLKPPRLRDFLAQVFKSKPDTGKGATSGAT